MNTHRRLRRQLFFTAGIFAGLPFLAQAAAPTVNISPTGTQTIVSGGSVTYSSDAADADGNMQAHHFYYQDPEGDWSWGSGATGLTFNTSTEAWYGAQGTSSRSIIATATRTGTFHVMWSAGDGASWTDSTTYTLVVNAASAPSITTHPQASTVNAAFDVTFQVTATGTGLGYQWRKGGTNISGATTATLALTSVATTAAGNYDVVVTNTAGSATSNTAALTVNDPNADSDGDGIPNMSETALGTSSGTTSSDSSNTQQQVIHRPTP